MLINYFDCKFEDCESEDFDDETLYIYNCTHPENKTGFCEVDDNKYCSKKGECALAKNRCDE